MFKLKVSGLDKIQKRLDEMKKPEFVEGKLTEIICEKVPEANAERHNFKYTHRDGKVYLDPAGVSPDLYSKIMTALAQQSTDPS